MRHGAGMRQQQPGRKRLEPVDHEGRAHLGRCQREAGADGGHGQHGDHGAGVASRHEHHAVALGHATLAQRVDQGHHLAAQLGPGHAGDAAVGQAGGDGDGVGWLAVAGQEVLGVVELQAREVVALVVVQAMLVAARQEPCMAPAGLPQRIGMADRRSHAARPRQRAQPRLACHACSFVNAVRSIVCRRRACQQRGRQLSVGDGLQRQGEVATPKRPQHAQFLPSRRVDPVPQGC